MKLTKNHLKQLIQEMMEAEENKAEGDTPAEEKKAEVIPKARFVLKLN